MVFDSDISFWMRKLSALLESTISSLMGYVLAKGFEPCDIFIRLFLTFLGGHILCVDVEFCVGFWIFWLILVGLYVCVLLPLRCFFCDFGAGFLDRTVLVSEGRMGVLGFLL